MPPGTVWNEDTQRWASTEAPDQLELDRKYRALDEARERLAQEERDAAPEPIPGIDWAAWNQARLLRAAMTEGLDEAKSRLDTDPWYVIGDSSMAEGFGTFRGYDPATGIEWRLAVDPDFSAMSRGREETGLQDSEDEGSHPPDIENKAKVGFPLRFLLIFGFPLTVCALWALYSIWS